ncbi:MAG: chloride channel protein [Methanomicrobiaceae archaeon]|nr:chloride channel protein [Methanomicrobiaceae archaeon]
MEEKIPQGNGARIRFAITIVLLAVAAGGAMVLFLLLQAAGTALIWPDSPPSPFFTLLAPVIGGLAVGLCLHRCGDHAGMLQQTIDEFQRTGRFEPEHLPGVLASIYLSLLFGASLGPEVAAIDMGGSMGTWLGDREGRWGQALGIAGVAGSLAGFGFYLVVEASRNGTLYPLPPYAFVPVDLVYAAGLGLAGAAAGVAFIASYHLFARLMAPLSGQPVVRGLLGGLGLGLAGTAVPLVLFSGQAEFQTVLAEGAGMGAAALLVLAGVKILASTWCLATVFKGGPVFPLIFAGGTLGMAVALLVPAVPPALAITAVMAGMIACVLKSPLVVIVLLVLIFLQPGVVLPIIIATLIGSLVTRRVTMIPGPRRE